MDPLMNPMQALALSDAFGSMRALGRGEQFQGRALPLMMQQAAQRQQQDAENAQSDAYLKAMGFPAQGGQQGTPDMMPGNPLGGQQAMPELAGGQYNPAAQQMPLGQPMQPQQPQGGLGAMPPMIRQQVQALVASGDRAGAASLLREYSLKAATQAPANPFDRYKVVPGVGLVDLAAGDKPGVAIPAREGRPQADPSSVQEYEYARQNGFPGSYTDFLGTKKGDGFRYTGADGSTVEFGNVGGRSDVPTATRTEAIQGRNAFDAIMTGFDDYEALVQEGGTSVLPGQYKDQLLVARRSLQLQMKELFNLGVLNGPDLELMDQLLVDATDPTNVALDATGISDFRERNKTNITQLRKLMADMVEPKLQSAGEGTRRSAAPPDISKMSLEELQAMRKQLAGQ